MPRKTKVRAKRMWKTTDPDRPMLSQNKFRILERLQEEVYVLPASAIPALVEQRATLIYERVCHPATWTGASAFCMEQYRAIASATLADEGMKP